MRAKIELDDENTVAKKVSNAYFAILISRKLLTSFNGKN